MQERQQDLDDDLVGNDGFAAYRFPGVEQRSSALKLHLADRRVLMQIHVQLCQTLPLNLTAAQQRQQRVMDPYPQPLLQLPVGGPSVHLVDQTPNRLPQAAIHREMHIARTP
jgi:hypothetical protein